MAELAQNTAEKPSADSEGTDGVTRREFLATMLVAVAFVGTAAGVVNAVVRFLIPPKEGIGGSSEVVEVASLSELPDGAAKDFAYNGVPCAVINVGGEIKGFSRVCTHLQCAIDWDTENRVFECPCHAAIFDSNGKVVSGPAPAPLPELKVKVKNDKVYVGGWA